MVRPLKKTQLTDALRNIRVEFVAYISIVVIGMLAAIAYLSVAYSAATLKKDALNFFDDNDLWDYEISSTLLMGEEDLAAIRALDGVKEAERIYQVNTALRVGSGSEKVTVMALPERISRPVLLDGRMPVRAGECAVEKELLNRCALSLGQQIRLEDKLVAGIDPLKEKELVITGVFQTPDHITYMIPVTPYIFVTEDGFDREALKGDFMGARIRVENAPADRYSDAYWQTLKPLGKALSDLGDERGPQRLETQRGEYEAQLHDSQTKLDEAAEKLREGRETLEAGYRDLELAADQLQLSREKLDGGGNALNQALEQLKDGAAQLESARKGLESLRPAMAMGPQWILIATAQGGWPAGIGVTREEFARAYAAGERIDMDWLYEKSGYNAGARELREAMAEYGRSRLDWYYLGEEYLDGMTRLESSQKQLEKGERELAEGQADYDAAERELKDARKALDQLTECRWVTLSNRGNAGYLYAQENFEKLASLSMSFSAFFLLVGALVIYATIGRMVEQHRRLIGATKAMGLYNREVFAKYLFFACSAILLGVGLGILLSWHPLQRTVLEPYEELFTYGAGTRSFLPLDTGLVAAGAFTISLVAVYLGCSQLLRAPAVELMQDSVPATGRKKARRSSGRSLYSRLIFRNMRTDWTRVLVTIASVAGGCMLMVIGFTLRYGISAVTGRQFGQIMTYEADVFYNADENADAAAEIEAILDQNALPHARVRKASSLYDADGTLYSLTLIVADEGELEGFYHLHSVADGSAIPLPESGALVPRRFWEAYGIGAGDTAAVYDDDMKLRELKVAGVFENYFGQLFFLTPEGFEEAFGAEAGDNCVLVKTGGVPLDGLREKLAGVKGLVNIEDAAAERTVVEQFSATLSFVVWFMLFLAALMACFIVANFTMTYLQRKTRELTVMRINGFSADECVRYAAVDLLVTTALGTLLGLVVGGLVGYRILLVTETPYLQMAREPVWQTYVFSALVTCLFSALTNGLALRRVKRLKLSDIS